MLCEMGRSESGLLMFWDVISPQPSPSKTNLKPSKRFWVAIIITVNDNERITIDQGIKTIKANSQMALNPRQHFCVLSRATRMVLNRIFFGCLRMSLSRWDEKRKKKKIHGREDKTKCFINKADETSWEIKKCCKTLFAAQAPLLHMANIAHTDTTCNRTNAYWVFLL